MFDIYCTNDLLSKEFKLSMNLISREELKQKLVFVDEFKLVNALGEWGDLTINTSLTLSILVK
jgi:hypothetical protein